MFVFRVTLALGISAALLMPPAYASRVHRGPTSGQTHKAHKLSHTKPVTAHRTRGQQGIDTERATQIQQALIREHYMTGEASGSWDADTISAMQKYQADHGWQTKLTPDARALKTLGLGPDYSGAINAHGANFAPPPAADNISSSRNPGFAAAGVNQ